jgi:hypothetical protein
MYHAAALLFIETALYIELTTPDTQHHPKSAFLATHYYQYSCAQ